MASYKKITQFFTSTGPDMDAHQICATIVKEIVQAALDAAIGTPNPSHQGDTVKKDTLDKWQTMYTWLRVATDENKNIRLKCDLCTKFKIKTVWASDGTSNIQKSTIDRHNESVEHCRSYRMSMQAKCFDCILESGKSDQEGSYEVSGPDKILIRTVYTLMKNDIPLDKLNAFLDLQCLNGLDVQYKNLSWTSVSDICECISKVLMKNLIEKISKSEYYALLIDETTDITVSKRLSICVRYFYAGSPETSFMGNIELPDGRAHTITETLYQFLTELGIDVLNCISLATDGSSVMMGHKSGVGVQVKSKYAPFITQTHCVAHRLNLAVTDSIKQIDVLNKFKDKFANLYHYISGSGNRVYELKKMQTLLEEPELTIKEPYSVRWLGLKRAVEAVYESYGALLATLSEMASNNVTAKGLYKYFSTYKTALLLGLMIDIHSELAVLSCNLQEQNIIFSDIAPLIDSTVGKLEIMKTQEGLGLADMRASITASEEKAFYKGDELHGYGKAADTQFDNVKTEYLNNLIKNIKKRIRRHDCEILKCLSDVFQPHIVLSMSQEEMNQTFETLGEQYGTEKKLTLVQGDMISGFTESEKAVAPLIDKHDLGKEWQNFYGMLKGSYRGYSLHKLCQAVIINHHKLLPNLAKLAKIALCIEVTSVECERSFSAQNRIKTKFRSSLKDRALQSLLVVSMLGPDCRTFDPKPSAHLWLTVKARRKKRLKQDYAPREMQKRQKTC